MNRSNDSISNCSRSIDLRGSCQVLMNVRVGSRRTSLRLHRDIWSALREICGRETLTIHELCTRADRLRQGEPLAESVRILALSYFRDATHMAEAVLQTRWAGSAVEEESCRDGHSGDHSGDPSVLRDGCKSQPDAEERRDMASENSAPAILAQSDPADPSSPAGHRVSVGQAQSSRRILSERYGRYLDKCAASSSGHPIASDPRPV